MVADDDFHCALIAGTAKNIMAKRRPATSASLPHQCSFATVVITPPGLLGAWPAFSKVSLLSAGVRVGICSSVILYITDQLAMARLRRATFALMLALLPVFATIIGALVLHQQPTMQDIFGIAFVAEGVASHRQEKQ
jgi:inner membrane transporter RhtA